MNLQLDKMQIMIDYVNEIKPFHTKIYQSQMVYQFNEQVGIDIKEDRFTEGIITFNYEETGPISNDFGWDVGEWDTVWKYGVKTLRPIIDINPHEKFISFQGDVGYSFSMDSYAKGITPVDVVDFNPETGYLTTSRDLPWVLGQEVLVSCSLLLPIPLQEDKSYYVIPVTSRVYKLAESLHQALANQSIVYSSYSAGKFSIKAVGHYVNISPLDKDVCVVGTEYDIFLNKTKIYLTDQSFDGLYHGFVNIVSESNWDNPSAVLLTGGQETAGVTTVAITITEELVFDPSDLKISELISGGSPSILNTWGGDDGERIISPSAVKINENKFYILGDWRFFCSSEISSNRTILIPIHNSQQVIEISEYRYINNTPDVTEFTAVQLPSDFSPSTKLKLYTNNPFETNISTADSFWDKLWEQSPGTDENTADTMISESIEIVVDDGLSRISLGTWNGSSWEV